MESTNPPEVDFEWEELNPAQPDRHQTWAAVLGFLLLFLSFPFVSLVGTFSIIPPLFGTVCMAYGRLVGTTWYKDQLLPYMARMIGVSDFEQRRFLEQRRYTRVSLLIAGFLSAIPSDIIFRYYFDILLPLALIDPIFGLFAIALVLAIFGFYLLQVFLWMFTFNRILESVFSDVSHLVSFEQNWRKHRKKKSESVKADRIWVRSEGKI